MSTPCIPGVTLSAVEQVIYPKLFKATQLALANFGLHLVQDFPHFLLRDPKIFSDLKAHGAGNFSSFCFLQNRLFQFLTVHNRLHHLLPSFPPSRGRVGVEDLEI